MHTALVTAALLTCATVSSAQDTFTIIEAPPGFDNRVQVFGMNADGSRIYVRLFQGTSFSYAVYAPDGSFTPLAWPPFDSRRFISDWSDDASIFVGDDPAEGVNRRAWTWTEADGFTYFDALPGSNGVINSELNCVDFDGDTAGGLGLGALGDAPLRWTDTQGPANLTPLEPGFSEGAVTDISDDGTVLTGYIASSNAGVDGREAFIWTEQDGFTLLGDLPNGEFVSEPVLISADGSTVFGESNGGIADELFIWRQDTGMQRFPGPGIIFQNPQLVACSADGTIFTGNGRGTHGDSAYYYTPEDGLRAVRTIVEVDFDLAEEFQDYQNYRVSAMSQDGSVLTGFTTRSGFPPIIFVIRFDTGACTADFDADGDVDLGDFGVFGTAFGSVAGEFLYNPAADFDQDGDVDLGDFGIFGTQFGSSAGACQP